MNRVLGRQKLERSSSCLRQNMQSDVLKMANNVLHLREEEEKERKKKEENGGKLKQKQKEGRQKERKQQQKRTRTTATKTRTKIARFSRTRTGISSTKKIIRKRRKDKWEGKKVHLVINQSQRQERQ